jgi:hypothetical protein
MTAVHRPRDWRIARRVLIAAIVGAACTSEDVGGSEDGQGAKGGSTLGTGAGGQAAGGAGGVDTAGGRVNTDRSGSVVAPAPGTPASGSPDSARARAGGARP